MSGSEAPRWHRTQPQRYRLEGEICPNPECGIVIFPPRDICPDCHTQTKGASGQPLKVIVYDPSRAKIPPND